MKQVDLHFNKLTKDTIDRLDNWSVNNGFKGWDPYDIQGSNFWMKMEAVRPVILMKILRRIVFIFTQVCPKVSRKMLNIKPAINAKGMGLMLSGYSNLYISSNDKNYLLSAKKYAKWLINNQSKGFAGISWGYPFDWLSPLLIPKNTPSAVVTSIVGDGFYSLYKATGDIDYLEICNQISIFFTTSLNETLICEDRQLRCYSYTPIDDYKVHNANLFVGEFLIRIGKEIDNKEFIQKGIECGNFAISEQHADGYIPYWALEQTQKYSHNRIHTDHYHSGFEIRMLYSIYKLLGDDRFHRSYRKYFDWYNENMYEHGYIPKYTIQSKYPINVHTCAEAILCQAALLNDHKENKDKLSRLIPWVLSEMEFKQGAYIHTISKTFFGVKIRSKLEMMRWGQAWMFRALSEVKLREMDD